MKKYGKIVNGILTVIEKYDTVRNCPVELSDDEVAAEGLKEIIRATDVNPEERGSTRRPVQTYESAGNYIVARTLWVSKTPDNTAS